MLFRCMITAIKHIHMSKVEELCYEKWIKLLSFVCVLDCVFGSNNEWEIELSSVQTLPYKQAWCLQESVFVSNLIWLARTLML